MAPKLMMGWCYGSTSPGMESSLKVGGRPAWLPSSLSSCMTNPTSSLVPGRTTILPIRHGRNTIWTSLGSTSPTCNGSLAPALHSVTGASRTGERGPSKTQLACQPRRSVSGMSCRSMARQSSRSPCSKEVSPLPRVPGPQAGTPNNGIYLNGEGCSSGQMWTSSRLTCAPSGLDRQGHKGSSIVIGRAWPSLITLPFGKLSYGYVPASPRPTSTWHSKVAGQGSWYLDVPKPVFTPPTLSVLWSKPSSILW